MNKLELSRSRFTEADVKNFKSGALRTITNITRSTVNSKKRIPSQVYFKDFLHRYRTAFLNANFFVYIFQEFVDIFGITELKN